MHDQEFLPTMVATRAFVLLCAEEDDLALVQWVHAARSRGLAPQIVTGVEHDDAPLLAALSDRSCALFVVLRSEHLDAERMRAIKAMFGRHRRVEQRLFALRVDVGASAAIDRIAGELEGGSRPRSEVSMVIAIEDVFVGNTFVGNTAAGDTTVVAPPSVPTSPSVDRALHIAARAAEREVTAQFEAADVTLPMAAATIVEPVVRPRPPSSTATVWLAALGLGVLAIGGSVVALRATPVPTSSPPTVLPAAALPRLVDEVVAPDVALDEPAVVIRVQGERAVETTPTRARTPRRPAAPIVAAPTPGPAPIATPDAAPTQTSEAATPAADGLPTEPAPLEDAPPDLAPTDATPDAPAPAPPP